MDNACAITGRTALHYLSYEDTDRVEIDASSSDPWSTPAKIIGYLLGKGANVEAQDRHGNRVLHYLADHRHFNCPYWTMVRVVLRFGADLNATNNQGCSPVYLAARNCNIILLRNLLANGARNVHESDINVLEHILEREHGENAHTVAAIKRLLHRFPAETKLHKLHPMNLTGVVSHLHVNNPH